MMEGHGPTLSSVGRQEAPRFYCFAHLLHGSGVPVAGATSTHGFGTSPHRERRSDHENGIMRTEERIARELAISLLQGHD